MQYYFILTFTVVCRRMFPTLRVCFRKLDPNQKYSVLIDIVPVDNKRYRYAYHKSSWLVAGKADPPAPHRLYTHPDSPFTGDQLHKTFVSFEKVKLTNNEMDISGQVRTISLVLTTCSHVLFFFVAYNLDFIFIIMLLYYTLWCKSNGSLFRQILT